ncbi:MAG: hypothetical protein Q7R73_04710 [bacterium]|nr:hypothetical protein [bacterium]
MFLSIHSLNKTLFEGPIQKLTAKTAVGELTILDKHIPLLVPLMPGLLRIVLKPNGLAQGDNNEEATFQIGNGFLEVKPKGEVVVLANSA